MSGMAEMAAPRSTSALVIRLILVLVLVVMAVHFLADVAAVWSGSPTTPALVSDICGFHGVAALLPLVAVILLASLAFVMTAARAIPRRPPVAALIRPPA